MNPNEQSARHIGRREFIAGLAAGIGLVVGAEGARAQARMPTRAIPGTGETLPVVGLGSTRPVMSLPELGADRVTEIIRQLVGHGGRVVDTWPRFPENDAAFGRILQQPQWRDELFVSINLADGDGYAGLGRFEKLLSAYGRERIDLLNVGSLIGLDDLWPALKDIREAGRARYIGVTVAQAALYEQLERFLAAESPDFVMVNYSVTEREVEQRILPLLADRGIAVLVSRPFMNGAYFQRLENVPLPAWTSDFDCRNWAEFSLQYILANPNVTCVLTETTDPAHMAENALTASKPYPNAPARQRMGAFIDAL
jgi:diketogulonate reductase-like aldo/keto reductase